MESSVIPCCYFPTTVMFIDDDERFVKCLQIAVEDQLPCQIYTHPLEALRWLTKHYHPEPFTQRCVFPTETSYRQGRSIDININAIHHEIYRSQRFAEITVIVVDYAMPGMNGLTFCEQLGNLPIKKILLTGEAQAPLAINAFNQGLIHHFIRKDELSTLDKLTNIIHTLQQQYFQELSMPVIDSILKNPELPCYLSEPAFETLFENICQTYSICEYYLLDTIGSFLLLDRNGQPTWLAVKSEEEMSVLAEMAATDDLAVSAEILTPLQRREKLLFSFHDEDFKKTPHEWLPYLHAAQKLQGQKPFYYALIPANDIYSLVIDKMMSYQQYLMQRT